MELIIVPSIIFALASMVVVVLIFAIRQYKKQSIIRRIERQLVEQKERKFSILEALGTDRLMDRIERLVYKTGLKTDAEDVFFLFVMFNILLFFVLSALNAGIFAYIIPVSLFIVVPYAIESISQRKYIKFNMQFAEAVQDISDYLKITGNLITAMENVMPDLENPARQYFQEIINKVDAGVSLNTALKEFSDKIGSPLVEGWVDSVIFAGQMKANISDVCEKAAGKVKTRLKQNAKIRSMFMTVKVSMGMIALVLVMTMVMTYTSSPVFKQGFSTVAGKFVILYVVASYIITTLLVFRSIDKQSASI
jgi:tight adherence protein B